MLFFKSANDKTIEELNKLTIPYTKYEWVYTKEDEYTQKNGFYLSFSKNSFSGDIVQKCIENAFKENGFITHIIGNGFNAVNGTRLIIESNTISLEQIKKVKLLLPLMQVGDSELSCGLQ